MKIAEICIRPEGVKYNILVTSIHGLVICLIQEKSCCFISQYLQKSSLNLHPLCVLSVLLNNYEIKIIKPDDQ